MARGRGSLEQAFGKTLRELRTKHGLSQEALAHAAGRDRTYISLLERGKSSPSLRAIFDLALALQVRPSELIRRVEKRA